MNKKGKKNNCTLILMVLMMIFTLSSLYSNTSQFRGVNWADERDNFNSGIVYISGLSSSDNYNSAAVVADRVMTQFVEKLGTNTVRLPINEATVSGYWGTYTGAIDTILSKGKVILCFWSARLGVKPPNMTDFWNMWSTVVNKYGNNPDCYFEIFNEPNGYSKSDLGNLYQEWLSRYLNIPRGRVILDGTGMAQNVPDIGNDSRFDGCLIAVHEYSFWGAESWTSEQTWTNHFRNEVGSFADRTICTEWGYPNSPGTKNNRWYDYLDYSRPASNWFISYARALSAQMKAWKMGNIYWIGLRDGDWYSMTIKTGTGSNINLSIPNASGLALLQQSWSEEAEPTPEPTKGPTPIPQENPVWSGGSYTLDGTTDYEDLPDRLTSELFDFTIAFRAKVNSVDNWIRVFDFGGNTNIFMMFTPASGTTGNPYFCITLTGNDGEQGLNGTTAFPAGIWQYVAITRSGNTGILFIDGQEVDRNSNMTINPADMGNTLNNFIGRSQWEQDPYLNGEVDDFRVYNRALTALELEEFFFGNNSEKAGDVNSDNSINIVDALLIAQYYVGLPLSGVFIEDFADVNCDGFINIVDALLVAQYYVGLIDMLC